MPIFLSEAARFLRDCRGATAIEYSLIGALISLFIVAALGSTGLGLGELYQETFTGLGSTIADTRTN